MLFLLHLSSLFFQFMFGRFFGLFKATIGPFDMKERSEIRAVFLGVTGTTGKCDAVFFERSVNFQLNSGVYSQTGICEKESESKHPQRCY